MEKKELLSIFMTFVMAVATVAIAIATIHMNTVTSELVKLNEKLIEQERRFNLPFLSFWQESIPTPVNSDLVSPEEVRHRFKGFCLRNDGRTSTGDVSVFALEESNFTIYVSKREDGVVQLPYFTNIPTGEGNCTDINIWYKPCFEGIRGKCDISSVPTGMHTIPIKVRCALCEENEREVIKELKICVNPSQDCD